MVMENIDIELKIKYLEKLVYRTPPDKFAPHMGVGETWKEYAECCETVIVELDEKLKAKPVPKMLSPLEISILVSEVEKEKYNCDSRRRSDIGNAVYKAISGDGE